MNNPPDSRTYTAFFLTMVIGGANFIAVSLSNRELPPLFGAALRFSLAAILFFIISRAWHIPIAHGRDADWCGNLRYSLMSELHTRFYITPWWALMPGTVSVIVATVPLLHPRNCRSFRSGAPVSPANRRGAVGDWRCRNTQRLWG